MKTLVLAIALLAAAVVSADPPRQPHHFDARQIDHRSMAIAIRALENRVNRLEGRLHRMELRERSR